MSLLSSKVGALGSFICTLPRCEAKDRRQRMGGKGRDVKDGMSMVRGRG